MVNLGFNYGPLPNSQLLTYYGFCLERNTCDSIVVELGELTTDPQECALLESVGITTAHVLQYVDCAVDTETSSAVWPQVVREASILTVLKLVISIYCFHLKKQVLNVVFFSDIIETPSQANHILSNSTTLFQMYELCFTRP